MDLRKCIDESKELREVKVIEGLNWNLEIGAITHLLAREPNPPDILFEKILGHKPGYRILVKLTLLTSA